MRNVNPGEIAAIAGASEAESFRKSANNLPAPERIFVMSLMDQLSASNSVGSRTSESLGISFERWRELTLWTIDRHREITVKGFALSQKTA